MTLSSDHRVMNILQNLTGTNLTSGVFVFDRVLEFAENGLRNNCLVLQCSIKAITH